MSYSCSQILCVCVFNSRRSTGQTAWSFSFLGIHKSESGAQNWCYGKHEIKWKEQFHITNGTWFSKISPCGRWKFFLTYTLGWYFWRGKSRRRREFFWTFFHREAAKFSPAGMEPPFRPMVTTLSLNCLELECHEWVGDLPGGVRPVVGDLYPPRAIHVLAPPVTPGVLVIHPVPDGDNAIECFGSRVCISN